MGPRIPQATYRMQFSGEFRFDDAGALIPYLQGLGITDLYASPLLEARRGSPHGYDVINPGRINPDIGGDKAFHKLLDELKSRGMGFLLDIVPNHMAANSGNPWWMDILENGRDSPYAGYFDIDWDSPQAGVNKVLLPVLGDELDTVLSKGELMLKMENSGFFIYYYDQKFPLSLKSYSLILAHALREAERDAGPQHEAYREMRALLRKLNALPDAAHASKSRRRNRLLSHQAIKRTFAWMIKRFPVVAGSLEKSVAFVNEEPNTEDGPRLLKDLLSRQVYELAFWRRAAREINYRRFFDISDLVGVRVEKPEVFHAVHDLILDLAKKGLVSGLRIDHIDGLMDPLQYLRRLQLHLARGEEGLDEDQDFYVLVEKILGSGETLPGTWPVYGTTGYEFISLINNVFVDPAGMPGLTATYQGFTGSPKGFEDVVFEKKRMVMHDLFQGDMNALGSRLGVILREAGTGPLPTPLELTAAVIVVTASLPVYRTYIRTLRACSRDCAYIEDALHRAKKREPALAWAIDCLGRVLLLDLPPRAGTRQAREWLSFVMKWQQSTGPIMAKGYEDTALYCYNRLISLNEVGGDPETQGITLERFHDWNMERQADWPHTLNASATHDTKRGEDVRARLNVLSEIPEEWNSHLECWQTWHEPYVRQVKGMQAPDRDMQMLLYQTLLGAWPVDGDIHAFRERLKEYAVKAAREAKTHTSWLDPDQEYEEAVLEFIDAVLRSENREFLEDFLSLQGRLAGYGMLNSLSGTVLKMTCPGVPDIYRGAELWDLSLVDPDNRRPVDFALRTGYLEAMRKIAEVPGDGVLEGMLENWSDGRIKLYTMYRLLQFRRSRPGVFNEGNYVPAAVFGGGRKHVCAFTRRRAGQWALVIVPRLLTGLVTEGVLPLGHQVWGDSACALPKNAPEEWRDIFTGDEVRATDGRVMLGDIFGRFPVAVLQGGPEV